MKKRTIGKLLAFVLAMTMVFGNAMTTFACDDMYGECDGGCQKEWSGDGDGEHTIIGDGWSGDSGNSGGGSSDSGSSGGGSDDAPSYDNSYDSGYDNSYSAPPASYDSYDDQTSFDAGSGSADAPYVAPESDAATDTAGSGSADAPYVAPKSDAATDTEGYKRDGARLTVDNFETAWHLVRSANGTYNVKHKGQDAYMAQLMDAAGNAVGFKGAGMYRAEDGRLFINIVTADGVDTTGYTVCTWKGAESYLPKLGISGVCLNNTVMVDADAIVAAEAAAAAAAVQ